MSKLRLDARTAFVAIFTLRFIFILNFFTMFALCLFMLINFEILTTQDGGASLLEVSTFKSKTLDQFHQNMVNWDESDTSLVAITTFAFHFGSTRRTKDLVQAMGTLLRFHVSGDHRETNSALRQLNEILSISEPLVLYLGSISV